MATAKELRAQGATPLVEMKDISIRLDTAEDALVRGDAILLETLLADACCVV